MKGGMGRVCRYHLDLAIAGAVIELTLPVVWEWTPDAPEDDIAEVLARSMKPRTRASRLIRRIA